MSATFEQRVVHVRGRPVRYLVSGQGEPVILVHGLSGSTRWWLPTLPVLTARYRVYAIILPGFGAVSRRQPLVPLTEVAAWLHDVTEALGLSRMHLIGHSLGGLVCIRLATSHPQDVCRLVLIGAAGVPVVPDLRGYMMPMFRTARHLAPKFLLWLVYDALRTGPRTLWRVAIELQQQDAREVLGEIQASTLIIWGENDELVPLWVGELLQREIPDARLFVVPRAGHTPMVDNPTLFSSVVLDFLAGRGVGR